jgi:hypothetical protein
MMILRNFGLVKISFLQYLLRFIISLPNIALYQVNLKRKKKNEGRPRTLAHVRTHARTHKQTTTATYYTLVF